MDVSLKVDSSQLYSTDNSEAVLYFFLHETSFRGRWPWSFELFRGSSQLPGCMGSCADPVGYGCSGWSIRSFVSCCLLRWLSMGVPKSDWLVAARRYPTTWTFNIKSIHVGLEPSDSPSAKLQDKNLCSGLCGAQNYGCWPGFRSPLTSFHPRQV